MAGGDGETGGNAERAGQGGTLLRSRTDVALHLIGGKTAQRMRLVTEGIGELFGFAYVGIECVQSHVCFDERFVRGAKLQLFRH